MTKYPSRWIFLLAAWCGAACHTAAPTTTTNDAPLYTRSAEHYRAFADADALAHALRFNADTGPLLSAHRGGPLPAFPENAVATFEQTLRYAPALIECDVRMSQDSVLVLMHDETLDRTTTGKGNIADHPFYALRQLLLVDTHGITTPFRIPTLNETLSWAEGRAVLTLDVKRDVPPERIVEAVRKMEAENRVVIIIYAWPDLLYYYRLAPDLVYSVPATTTAEVQDLIHSGVNLSRVIAFTGVGEVKPEVIEQLHTYNIRAMVGTFGMIDKRAQQEGPEVYHSLLDQGIDVIATDLVPLTAQALNTHPAAKILLSE